MEDQPSVMVEDSISDEKIQQMDQKKFRKEFPSGWMELTRYETLVLIIDALLEAPMSREFTISEISTKSGVSKRSIGNHIDDLVELGILRELQNGREESRYSIDNDSPITRILYDLNMTVQQVKDGSRSKSIEDSIPEENANAGQSGRENRYNVNVPPKSTYLPRGGTKGGFRPTDAA